MRSLRTLEVLRLARARRRACRARWPGGGASPACFRKRVGALVLLGLGCPRRPRLLSVVVSSSPKMCRASISPWRSRSARLSTYWSGQIEREHGLAHLALAGLDLLGDRDLFLAREERDAAHLLEVHADRIGGLAGSPLGLLGLGLLLGPLRLRRPCRAPRRAPSPRRASTSMSISPSIETTWSSSSGAAPSPAISPLSRVSLATAAAGRGPRERGASRTSATDFFTSRFSGRFTQRYPHARSRAEGPGSLGSRTALARTM